jgi:TPR repeat protein
MDLTRAANFPNIAADQQRPDAQRAFAALLWDGRGVLNDFALPSHFFRLAAAQGVAESQYRYAIWLLSCHSGDRDIAGTIHSLKLSADNGSPDGQFAIACMRENAIGQFHSIDLGRAV